MNQPSLEYTLLRTDRKTLSIEVKSDGRVIVHAPLRLPQKEIDTFLQAKAAWIAAAKEKMQNRAISPMQQPLTADEIAVLKARAAAYLPERAAFWSKRTGLVPTGIRITDAQKRFGSCSGKNSLCFSYRLMCYPPEDIEYVVLHEIAHIRYHNHSKAFYALIARYMPDFRQRERHLKNM
ncbi:MAG: M48 family metallopeptidase [Clostridia bacterium]|nr:M48 family metallopeptidase [Clostridia bacterium]